MPWGLIAEVGLKFLNAIFAEVARRDALKKQMLEFISRFDQTIFDNEKLRREYDDLVKQADKE